MASGRMRAARTHLASRAYPFTQMARPLKGLRTNRPTRRRGAAQTTNVPDLFWWLIVLLLLLSPIFIIPGRGQR
jgi:hypothetical protein